MGLRFERGPRDELKTLHPACFALVMATGAVAVAAQLHGIPVLPVILFWLNLLFLSGLVLLTAIRILRYPAEFLSDIGSHSRGVGFFTTAAASAVFGIQLIVQMNATRSAVSFWIVAAVLWAVLTYGVLAVLIVKADKPGLAEVLNGGWLVSVVTQQALAVLTVLVAASDLGGRCDNLLMFAALVLWLGGGALYMWLMTLIVFRCLFVSVTADDLTPPYWINMGAVAISTLAGATLIEHAALSPVIVEILPFVAGFTLFFWAIATWWIPMLLVLGVWRYLLCGVPFAYDVLYWDAVFPLGMYSLCTFQLTQIYDVPFLMPLSSAFMIIGLAAWVAAFAGFLDSRRRRPMREAPDASE